MPETLLAYLLDFHVAVSAHLKSWTPHMLSIGHEWVPCMAHESNCGNQMCTVLIFTRNIKAQGTMKLTLSKLS